ncbi:hypothetical protein JHS3_19000 [Jeongeupia sp. HS-3]|uniref:hypothetical protein n=1 Tax=Jeongeupia sp. HS-3 TaxID=1009682 RepID=UPI0018A5D7E0|nr:hypothetical protein [Jeongeupia sp. HS-3]BCL76164.1 hypothetical protein JHS3_19000 [Jeongeupia sp. HS-3]
MRALMFGSLLLAGAALADVVDTVQLRHKTASELAPLLQQAFPDAAIQGFYDQLVVRAPDEATFARISALVSRLDTPTRRLTVSVEQRESGSRSGLDADGSVVISNRGSGAVVAIDAQRSRDTRQAAVQRVTTIDGGRAMISLGESRFVPTLSWVFRPGYSIVTQGGQWQSVGSGFWVEPQVVGERVQLRLYPQSSRFNGNGSIDQRAVYSEVAGALGEWLPVGESTQQARGSGIGSRVQAATVYTVWVRVDAN